jgi:hypothetical protein
VLCLNEGQLAGLISASEDVLTELQTPFLNLTHFSNAVVIRSSLARHERTCHDNHKWFFSNEIMLPTAERFLEMRTTEPRLDDQDQDQSRIVLIKSTHAFTHAVLQQLVIDESAQKKRVLIMH